MTFLWLSGESRITSIGLAARHGAYFPRPARSRTFASPSPLPSRFCTLPYMLVARRRYRPAWQLWSDGIRTRQMTLLYFR